MKKRYIIILAVIVTIILVGFIAFNRINANLEALIETPISEVNPSSLEDGIYEGSYSSFPVSVDVAVTISSGVITSIEITKHDNGQGEPAEVIIESVIDLQSVQVDAIAGATYSSVVILLAISDALNNN